MDKSLDELISENQKSGAKRGFGAAGADGKKPGKQTGKSGSSVFARLGTMPTLQAASRGPRAAQSGLPPDGYVCKLCFNPGHWVQNCGLALAGKGGHAGGGRGGRGGRGSAATGFRGTSAMYPPDDYLGNVCYEPGHWTQNSPMTAQGQLAGGMSFGKGRRGAGRGGKGRGGMAANASASAFAASAASAAAAAAAAANGTAAAGGRSGARALSHMQEMMRNRVVKKEGNDTVIQLYETEVVRISGTNLVLNSGGYMTQMTLDCINEAIAKYGLTVKVAGDGWQVGDGKFRLLRFYDGMLIEGGATLAMPTPAASAAGPARTYKRTVPARHAPY